jgi:hypothetical protein
MKNKFIYIIFSLFASISMQAQRSYATTYLENRPTIDGVLEPEYWSSIPVADGFTTSLPSFGESPQHATEVRMAYHKEGIYVGAICYSNKIRGDGSRRDDVGSGDYFSIGLDTWNDDQNAFTFTTNAFGQRIDGDALGRSFDAFWSVRTSKEADRWVAEMFIPFTALRFPKEEVADWGLQFTRYDRSTGQLSTWNPLDPLIKDVVLQYGELAGLENHRQKRRVGIGVVGNVENTDSDIGSKYIAVAALDGKIGLGSASTLDFTILPEMRNKLYIYNNIEYKNYSYFPFGTNRQLYTEGGGIFSKGLNEKNVLAEDNFFLLQSDPRISFSNQKMPTKLNAARFSTRTRNNMGISIYNELYRSTSENILRYLDYAPQIVLFPTYTDIAIEKNWRNNSWVHFSQSVLNLGVKGFNNYKSSASMQLRDRTNRFEVRGRIDGQFQNKGDLYDGNFGISKVNGKWTYGLSYTSKMRTQYLFNADQLPFPLVGFMGLPNVNKTNAFVQKNTYKPSKYWQNQSTYLQIAHSQDLYVGRWNETQYVLGKQVLTHNFRRIGASVNIVDDHGFSSKLLFTTSIYNIRNTFLPIGFKLEYATDERKRWTTQYSWASTWTFGRNEHVHGGSANSKWVANNWLSLGGGLTFTYFDNKLSPNTTTSTAPRIVVLDVHRVSVGLGIVLHPARWINLSLNSGIYVNKTRDESIIELQPNGLIGFLNPPNGADWDGYSSRYLQSSLQFFPNAASTIILDTGLGSLTYFGQKFSSSHLSLKFLYNFQRQ